MPEVFVTDRLDIGEVYNEGCTKVDKAGISVAL